MTDYLIKLSHKANDDFCELGNKLDIAKEYLQGIINMCDGNNEDHAKFYFSAKEALEKIDQKSYLIYGSIYKV